MKQTLEQILQQDCTDFVKIENIKILISNNSQEVIGYLLYDLTVMGYKL